MQHSPFKFLDSYTKEDRNIFFGRDNEIETLYTRAFQSKLLIIYGVSGTGKSSLIHCGLANKFNESDWLPINIRRGTDINESVRNGISKLMNGGQQMGGKNKSAISNLQSAISNLYLDHFKPIFLIFDQFEEVFIFGNKEERELFISQVREVVQSEMQCRFIFCIREEYLASMTEFEEIIPDILLNRLRIEKMNRKQAKEVIEGPCRVAGIELEENFAETLLEKLAPGKTEIELTYLQVYLDKIYHTSSDTVIASAAKQSVQFTLSLLEQLGNVGDLLGSFLEEQIAQLPNPDEATTVLKTFVSTQGTKTQMTEEEVRESSKILGKDLSSETVRQLITRFVDLRIVKDKDENNKYELRHDALAAKIYEKITVVEKELIEIRLFVENAFRNYEKRNILLSEQDLNYIAPYQEKLFLKEQLNEFVNKSKNIIRAKRKHRARVALISSLWGLAILLAFTYWMYSKYRVSRANELAAMALINVNKDPTLAYLLAEEAYQTNPKGDLPMKALLSAYAEGPFYNEIKGNEYAVSPDSKHIVTTSSTDSTIRIYDMEGKELHSYKHKERLEINGIVFSPDNKNVLLYSPKGNLIKVEMNNFKEEFFTVDTGDLQGIWEVTYSFDGKNILIVSADRTVRVWNNNLRELFVVKDYGGVTVQFSSDSKHILYADTTNAVKILDLNGTEKQKIKLSAKKRAKIKFSKDGNYIIIQSIDEVKRFTSISSSGEFQDPEGKGNTTVWNKDGKMLFTLGNLTKFRISPDSKHILTTNDSTLFLWTMDGEKVSEIKLSGNFNPSFSADGKYILINTQHEYTDVWSDDGKYLIRLKGDNVGFSKDGKYVLTLDDNDNAVSIYGEKGKEVARLKGSKESIQDNKVMFTPDNKYVITAGNSDKIRIWKPDLKDYLYVNRAYFSPDGSLLLTVPYINPIIWNKKGEKVVQLLRKSKAKILTVKISNDNKYVSAIDFECVVYLWDMSGNLLDTIALDKYTGTSNQFSVPINIIDFSHNSRLLAFVDNRIKKVKIIKLNSKDSQKTELSGHSGNINSVAFSPTDNYLVTSSDDSTAIVWKYNPENFSCEKFSTIKGHKARVMSARFSPDGKYILTASDDSTARIWKLNGEQVFGIGMDEYNYNQPENQKNKLFFAEFSKDARSIIVWKYMMDTTYYVDPISLKQKKNISFNILQDLWLWGKDEPFFGNSFTGNSVEDNIGVSADGNLIVYSVDDLSTKLIRTDGGEVLTLKGNSPKFSPDGKYLIVIENNQLKMYPVSPEEILGLVNEEKIFGTVRQLTEKEREEFGVD